MQVYVEYALIENFCMDFSLLFAAKAASKNPAKYLRLALASVLGACFAVAYPLFNLGGALGIAIKLLAGVLMCALAGKFQTVKGFLKFSAIFAAATFVLGGGLIAVFSLAGVTYEQGGGFILSSVPVGIPLFCAIVLAVTLKKLKGKFSGGSKVSACCKIYSGQKCVTCTAFYDSGNKVYKGGVPVSIIPPFVAKMLACEGSIKDYVDIHTVAGKSKIGVFLADKVEIDDGKNKIERQNVLLGVSQKHMHRMVLHPDLLEVN